MRNFGKLALLAAVVGLVTISVIVFGARLGLWEPIVGYGLYRSYLNPLGAGIAALGVLAVVVHAMRKERAGIASGAIASVIGLACLAPLMASTLNPPQRAAPINDISTDTVNPPAFEVIDETRAGALNSLEYGGAEVAAKQAAAYPDIASLEADLSPDAAYERALEVAGDMGWEVVAADAERRRFEATARTSVFYFADDVLVVVTAQESGSRVDMRSVSRVGRSDQGVNAARIRAFQEQFSQ
ncbi:DUF1499 domain-containing protein [Puniceibacterium confluentis]|uniref:DUF1499 domain-containing protein n=1 Tax=Puniceibacterium confluentis TaxID=1958944 RepID=UPI0011B3740A|nr:DUF1499 domain-containing protein [Puniceibacterium confluentis]